MTAVIKVSDFTIFPGPRYKKLGSFSGEEFRDDYLIPEIERHGSDLVIDLDDTMGFGSSFLEECFGGLIRRKIEKETVLSLISKIKSLDDESLIIEIKSYVEDAIQHGD